MRNLYINPLLICDTYKLSHEKMLPKNCNMVYTNITARKSRVENVDKIVVAGIQYFVKEYLIERFNKDFFALPKKQVVDEFERVTNSCCGPGVIKSEHVAQLHDLGYLPLMIKALSEGTRCPIGVPFCTIYNTHKDFAWLTNFIETIFQCTLWRFITSATDCYELRKLGETYAKLTSDNEDFVDWQFHTFGMRGSSGLECSIACDFGHLLSFRGSDTVPTILFMEKYYGANCIKELVSGSVPAQEHSIIQSYGKENELETFRHTMEEVYPKGILSILIDTWDMTEVINPDNGYLVKLKDTILNRDGKIVCRPDSSDKTPLEIICGDDNPESKYNDRQRPVIQKGLIRCLDEIFGSTVNSKGYKELNPKIGAIYGDSLSYNLLDKIFAKLAEMGYASTNLVAGMGSAFHMLNRTRDSYSIACKSTACEHNGKLKETWKNPITDSASKKSRKGLLRVNKDFTVDEECTWDQEKGGILESVFLNGKLQRNQTLANIRETLANS